MVKEEQELRQKQVDDFNKKVVVENTHFFVNTKMGNHRSSNEKYLGIRQDETKKVGLRFGKKRLLELTAKQIMTQ